MRDNHQGKSIAQHTFIRRAGGIAFALVLALITYLLTSTPAGAEFESQCRLVSPNKCAECHPKTPGKCKLVSDHKNTGQCANCHDPCVEDAPPPDFNHMEMCVGCHESPHEGLGKIHQRHSNVCEADFDGDYDVDSSDLITFLGNFGRGNYNNPCTPENPCRGDFDGDRDVDAYDLLITLEDFGRNKFNKPCPKDPTEYNCNECHSGDKILIAVDSKHGTTARYADIVGTELCANGFQVDVALVHKNLETDISGYDGYVIGSPTYWGFPLKDLRKFLELNAPNFANKPTAYLYNSLEGAETGNVSSTAFWRFAYHPELKNYPTIFPLAEVLQAQVPPNGECNLDFNPAFQLPNYTNCDAPAWIGLMPGAWDPRKGFPVEYMPMELFGFGGYKPYFREGAAVEYAQTLTDIGFFDGACLPGNLFPTVTSTASTTSGTQPLEVAFTATASDPDGTIVSYLWTFGDGATSDQPNPSHTYSCSGTFTAKVKVTDNNCGIAVSKHVITVASAGGGVSFDCDVAPIFERRCNDCHGTAGGLNTNTCEDIQAGGNSGDQVVPGNKDASLLYQRIIGIGPLMPPTGSPLTADEIATVGAWIDQMTDPSCTTDFCSPPCAPF